MILTALFTLAIATPSADDGILAFADAFDRAQLTQDAAGLNEMIADELVFIDGSGKRRGKKDFIAGWTAQGDRFDPVVLIDRKVIPLGSDAAIVSAETTLAGTSGGQRFASRIRFADTFRRVGGKWRAVHIQVTPIR
ncbi:nuclear transport factor 2 family protein [Sphingomonas sp. UNC305MFCol5.2]|uniref:nuclear transport factor 2 family protein n=1 Tax=Sphingomonas sp. UNC305MFCol5.2 TaxID=1449076 RepID=UPI0004A73158|nr:nuclear transport factor 2 family protein [Sphingomonas sp. UNC305MFCol5.2]